MVRRNLGVSTNESLYVKHYAFDQSVNHIMASSFIRIKRYL